MTPLQQKLKALNACYAGIEWVGDRIPSEMWHQCERGDWLLWLAGKLYVDRKLLVLAACKCAREALPYVPEGELRPLRAIEAAEAWCRGEAGLDEARQAADAAADAAAAYATAAYAADAADADAADAARAAAYAAAAAARAADARATSLARSAELVRETIPFELIEEQLGETK